jgi:four helix bundle protein
MSRKGFKDLIVWQKAKDLAVIVYRITLQNKALARDFGLRDQMRRSVVSIASNLAEGDERDTDREAVRFFYIAKGSLAELKTQLEISYEVSYLEKEFFDKLEADCGEIGKMIGRLIKARQVRA